MKKTTKILAAAVCGCMVTPVHADEGNTVTITYTVASSYTFVIPDCFTTAENAEYTVEIGKNPIIPYGSQYEWNTSCTIPDEE